MKKKEQYRAVYDAGNWVVVREADKKIVYRTNSNRRAHDFADEITQRDNFYHYVDEQNPADEVKK